MRERERESAEKVKKVEVEGTRSNEGVPRCSAKSEFKIVPTLKGETEKQWNVENCPAQELLSLAEIF